jgi:transcriptional regulator with XRE-family HTH domain
MNQEITFGQSVKERRELLGLTQAELGRRVGCAAITIRPIEADNLRPSVMKAGLIPALRQGGLPGSEQWFIIEMLERVS